MDAIRMMGIVKCFGPVRANDGIDLIVKQQEIHCLLGENGTGKSTLMNILFGLYHPDAGEIYINEKKASITNPNDAYALGIGMVHQHFKLVECFTVLDNIIMGVEPTKHGFLQKAEAREKVLALSEKYGLHVDPDALIEDITVGMQQRTEILKMLYRENEILIFDEPTAVLTPQEIDELMQIMRNLAAEGFPQPAGAFFKPERSAPDYLPCGLDCSTIEYKSGTRAHLEDQGEHIVLNLGDQHSDLAGGHAEKPVKLPNPMYYLP